MITLITGAPGTGKTAYAVSLLMESEYYPHSAVLFNVREWKGEGRVYESPNNPNLYEAPRTVYLVDEAQTFWPSRVAGRPVPEIVDHLAKHRHISQDWILTCQHPGQLEIRIRNLVGRHIHLTRNALGVRFSEAGECREDLKFNRDESRKYSFPVQSLGLYKSDEGVTVHQKKGLKLPKKLIFLVMLILFLVATVVYFFQRSTIFGGASEPQQTGFMKSATTSPSSTKGDVLPLTQAESPLYYAPADPAFPEIAKAPRIPVACIKGRDACKCYDQAGQLIVGLPEPRCEQIVTGVNPLAVLYPKDNPASRVQVAQTEPPSREGGGVSKSEYKGM